MTNPTLATLQRIVETAESGQWPEPTEIDALRYAHEENLELAQRFKGCPPLIELPPAKRNAIFEWTDRGTLISRALHALAAFAGLSIQETTELLGGSPPAWGRLRAKAVLATAKSRATAAGDDDEPDDEVAPSRRFRGCREWKNWGFGVDKNGVWHLFGQGHNPSTDRSWWNIHRRATVAFSQGLMTDLATHLATQGAVPERLRHTKLNPTIKRLRDRLREAVRSAGYDAPEGNPLPFISDRRVWRPIVRFGVVTRPIAGITASALSTRSSLQRLAGLHADCTRIARPIASDARFGHRRAAFREISARRN